MKVKQAITTCQELLNRLELLENSKDDLEEIVKESVFQSFDELEELLTTNL